MRFLGRADAFVAKYMAQATILCVVLGVMLPGVFGGINRLNLPLFAFITFANSLGAGFRELRNVASPAARRFCGT